jgi:TonB family protein
MRIVLTIICLTLLSGASASAQDTAPRAGSNAASKSQASPELEEAARLNAEVLRLFGAGKYDEALPIAKRVLELRENAIGPNGLLVAYALNNIASIYTQRGKGGDAEPLFKRALDIVEKNGGAESDFAADINMQRGLLRLWERDYKTAAPLLEGALEVRERLHGAEDPALLNALFNVADLNFLRGDTAKGRETLGRAVAILRKQPPKKDEGTASRLKSYLCRLYSDGGKAEDKELSSALSNTIWRLEEPETAEQYEREKNERAAHGDSDKQVVEGGVLNGHVTDKPAPEYPIAAKQQRVMGTVIVKITVDESGRVIKAEPVCGHPLLARAAVDAARAARFTPTLLSGRPVKVSGVITYNFVLH